MRLLMTPRATYAGSGANRLCPDTPAALRLECSRRSASAIRRYSEFSKAAPKPASRHDGFSALAARPAYWLRPGLGHEAPSRPCRRRRIALPACRWPRSPARGFRDEPAGNINRRASPSYSAEPFSPAPQVLRDSIGRAGRTGSRILDRNARQEVTLRFSAPTSGLAKCG